MKTLIIAAALGATVLALTPHALAQSLPEGPQDDGVTPEVTVSVPAAPIVIVQSAPQELDEAGPSL
ncbi:MAG: hypothetical protein RB149_07005 [Armatimonadota bacterium]|nr:hypothetical protein [Armatimonadota bacterium]MDR7422426.1 hypothetical protein [Armatimonadota bacterium]